MFALILQSYACTIESQIPAWYKSINTIVSSAQELFVNFHTVDALLGELKCSKENGVDYAGSRHGHSKAWSRSAWQFMEGLE
jgi:hypothetical protein